MSPTTADNRTQLRCMLLIAFSMLATVSITGCSMNAWYGGMKFAAENERRRRPPGEIEGCLARLRNMTYEEYERKRSGQGP